MSQQDIECFIGRLLTDDQFRQRAVEDFRQLCFDEGFRFTDEEAAILLSMELNLFAQWSEALDPRIRRCGFSITGLPGSGGLPWE